MSSIELACTHCKRCHSVADAESRLEVADSVKVVIDFLECAERGDKVYAAKVGAMEALAYVRDNIACVSRPGRSKIKETLAACYRCDYTKQVIVDMLEKYILEEPIEEESE